MQLNFVKGFASQQCHIAVVLGNQFHRCVHTQNRNACVYRHDVPVCHISSYRAATALVDLAHSGGLPLNICLTKDLAYVEHSLGRSIRCATLTTGAGVLGNGDSVVEQAVVPLVAGFCKVGVKGIGHVSRQAEGVFKAAVQAATQAVANVLHKGVKGLALQPEKVIKQLPEAKLPGVLLFDTLVDIHRRHRGEAVV